MTTLLELLKITRESFSKKDDSNIKETEEIKTEEKEDTSDNISEEIVYITIADGIIKESKLALRNKKFKGNNSCRRLAKSISSGNITTEQLNKCFQTQRRFKENHPNYKLVGGNPMHQLKTLLKQGITLKDALNHKIER